VPRSNSLALAATRKANAAYSWRALIARRDGRDLTDTGAKQIEFEGKLAQAPADIFGPIGAFEESERFIQQTERVAVLVVRHSLSWSSTERERTACQASSFLTWAKTERRNDLAIQFVLTGGAEADPRRFKVSLLGELFGQVFDHSFDVIGHIFVRRIAERGLANRRNERGRMRAKTAGGFEGRESDKDTFVVQRAF
jgi:hypothetical protein